MVKIQVNSQGKAYFTSGNKVLMAPNSGGGGGDTITATNMTGSTVNSGDKVWINENNGNYSLIAFNTDNRNFTTMGNPAISNKVVSNITGYNYLKFPITFNPLNNTWEIYTKINIESTYNKRYVLCLRKQDNFDNADKYGIGIGVNNMHFLIFGSTSGSDWEIHDTEGTYTILTDTDYWVKFGWNGTEYYLEYSLDGQTFTRDITITLATPVYSPLLCGFLGVFVSTDAFSPFTSGSIDLTQTYIKINNSVVWSAYGVEVTSSSYTGIADGTIAAGSSGLVRTVLES